MKIVRFTDFDFDWFARLPTQKRKVGNQGGRNKGVKYIDIVTAFDIETTYIDEIDQSIMYVWQWQIGLEWCVIGRTWDEFLYFAKKLCLYAKGRTIWVGVHNLSYEFQFLSGIYHFEYEDVFALQSRKILNAKMFNGQIELHCTYIHSNMSLAEWTKKLKVEHGKLSGQKFDYKKRRYPWTELSPAEIDYITYDVLGVVECIYTEMLIDNDNLYTLPQTSTGYVRREAKRAMHPLQHGYVSNQLPDYPTYRMLREAFRGGNTHANRFFANYVLYDVNSADRSSSYPDVICNCKFPVTPFKYMGTPTIGEFMKIWKTGRKAILARVILHNVRLKNKFWGFPYLPRDKCRNIKKAAFDNGRVLTADYLETTITDIDLEILEREYDFEIAIIEYSIATYGKLPKAFTDKVIEYYRLKTELKNVKSQEVFYIKAKNKLNAFYGLMVEDIVKYTTEFIDNDKSEKLYAEAIPKKAREILDDSGVDYAGNRNIIETVMLEVRNKNAFLPYQWGVWVTAWSRLRLEEGLWLAWRVEDDNEKSVPVYCDTDSVKYLGEVDWRLYNSKRQRDSMTSGAFATDPKGITHFMGVFEEEDSYKEFCTLGAKKYCYRYSKPEKIRKPVKCVLVKNKQPIQKTVYVPIIGNPIHLTVSGVSKKKNEKTGVSFAGEEMEKGGGITTFRKGYIFIDAGGVELKYNDFPAIGEYEIDGRKIPITRNVVIKDSTYEIHLTPEYENLILDNQELFESKLIKILDKLSKDDII